MQFHARKWQIELDWGLMSVLLSQGFIYWGWGEASPPNRPCSFPPKISMDIMVPYVMVWHTNTC